MSIEFTPSNVVTPLHRAENKTPPTNKSSTAKADKTIKTTPTQTLTNVDTSTQTLAIKASETTTQTAEKADKSLATELVSTMEVATITDEIKSVDVAVKTEPLYTATDFFNALKDPRTNYYTTKPEILQVVREMTEPPVKLVDFIGKLADLDWVPDATSSVDIGALGIIC